MSGAGKKHLNLMKSCKFTILVVALSCLAFTAQGAAKKGSSGKKTNPETDELFAQPKVFEIKIEIPSGSVESLKNDPHKYVKGVVREGNKIYSDAGIRLKGSGSIHPIEKRPSLAIKFNEFISGTRLYGHSKIFLDNSHQDPTFVGEAIGGELFRAAAVPAPRHNYAHVELNGRDLGLYVLSEAVNKDFLGKYFSRTKGNLYEGENADVNEKLEKDSGDESKDQKDLKALAAAAQEADSAVRWKKITSLLDVPGFMSFAATEVFTWHHDGYCLGKNNYRIYNDPGTNQMVFIPHGYDELFVKPKGPLFPEWKGLVAKSLLDSSEGRAKYRERMATLLGTAFKTETINALIDKYSAVAKPALTGEAAQKYDAALTQLRSRIAERIAFIQAEVARTK
jgi:spore coat protein CotH